MSEEMVTPDSGTNEGLFVGVDAGERAFLDSLDVDDGPVEAPVTKESSHEATPEAEPQMDADLDDEAEGELEAEAETEDDATASDEADDTESEDWALPEEWSLEDAAKDLGVDPEQLAASLRVKVGDDLVPLQDAIKGTLRESDYTRKTMALAEERKAFEATRAKQAEEWQGRIQQADTLAGLFRQQLSGEEAALQDMLDENSINYDPQGYIVKRAELDKRQRDLGQYFQHREQEQAALVAQHRQEHQKLARENIPELATPEGAEKFQQDMREVLPQYGYTPDQINAYMDGAWDYKDLAILRDAMKYRALEKGKPEARKKLAGKPKLRPNGRDGKGTQAQSNTDAIRRRLRSSNPRTKQRAAEDFLGAFAETL